MSKIDKKIVNNHENLKKINSIESKLINTSDSNNHNDNPIILVILEPKNLNSLSDHKKKI